MGLKKDLAELLEQNIINEATAAGIQDFYEQKQERLSNRLFIIFGILGAILVGLGIILIVAHNWEELSRPVKTILAFVPLAIGQLATGYTLLKKKESIAWREGSGAFLFLAIGACIALISQIYQIPGSLADFLLSWILLALPITYVLQSGIANLFYLLGITYYAAETGYMNPMDAISGLEYWLLLLASLPFYYKLFKSAPGSNMMAFHNWALPLSVVLALGTLGEAPTSYFLYLAYVSLFGCFYLFGQWPDFTRHGIRSNGFLAVGGLGIFIVLLWLSFGEMWENLQAKDFTATMILFSVEFWTALLLTGLLGFLLSKAYQKRFSFVWALPIASLLFLPIFGIGFFSLNVLIFINLLILAVAIATIIEGNRSDDLGVMNYGLLLIGGLMWCRFLDTDLSFTVRGLLFVIVGTGFFLANFYMMRRRKN